MASIDKNLPALLDEQAYTVECTYNKSQKHYTFVSNLQPRLQVGEILLVPEAGSDPTAMQLQHEANGLNPNEQSILRGAQKTIAAVEQGYRKSSLSPLAAYLAVHNLEAEFVAAKQIVEQYTRQGFNPGASAFPSAGFVCVRVQAVHDRVQIEPGSDMLFKWVAGRVDTSYYQQLTARNQQIVEAYGDAYKQNLRRSFATQVLGQLDENTASSIKALLAAPVAATPAPAAPAAAPSDDDIPF